MADAFTSVRVRCSPGQGVVHPRQTNIVGSMACWISQRDHTAQWFACLHRPAITASAPSPKLCCRCRICWARSGVSGSRPSRANACCCSSAMVCSGLAAPSSGRDWGFGSGAESWRSFHRGQGVFSHRPAAICPPSRSPGRRPGAHTAAVHALVRWLQQWPPAHRLLTCGWEPAPGSAFSLVHHPSSPPGCGRGSSMNSTRPSAVDGTRQPFRAEVLLQHAGW